MSTYLFLLLYTLLLGVGLILQRLERAEVMIRAILFFGVVPAAGVFVGLIAVVQGMPGGYVPFWFLWCLALTFGTIFLARRWPVYL